MLRVFAVDQATGETERVNTWTDLSILELWNDKSGATMTARDNGVHSSAAWLEILHRPYGSILVTDERGRSWSGRPFPTLSEQSDLSSTISFISDLTTLAWRVVTPRTDPAVWTAYTHRLYSGPANGVLYTLISDYCGPGAVHPLEHFEVADFGEHSLETVAIAARAELNVLEWVKLKATPARQRVTALWDQTAKKVVCRIEACSDLSSSVVFAPALMNETNWAQTITKPSYNQVIVMGQGEGTARQVVVTAAPAGVPVVQKQFDRRNIETLVDLQAEAQELLSAGAGSAQVTTVMADSAEQAYGADFFLGDLVKVVAAGAEFVEPVTAVATKATPGGTTRTVTAGFGPLNPYAQTKADLAELASKVSQIGAT